VKGRGVTPYRSKAVAHPRPSPRTFTVVAWPSMFRMMETDVIAVTRWRLIAWLHVWRYAWRNPYGSAVICPGTCVIDRKSWSIRRVA